MYWSVLGRYRTQHRVNTDHHTVVGVGSITQILADHFLHHVTEEQRHFVHHITEDVLHLVNIQYLYIAFKPSENNLLELLDKVLYLRAVLDNDHIPSFNYEYDKLKGMAARLKVGYTKLRHTKSIKLNFLLIINY